MKNLGLNLLVLAVIFSGLLSCTNDDLLDRSVLTANAEATKMNLKNCQAGIINWDNFAYDQAKVNHDMTFSWSQGSPTGNSQFKFEFLINGTIVTSATDLTMTTHSINQKLNLNDILEVRVYEDCGSGYDAFQTSGDVLYLSAVNTDDVVFRAKAQNSINDLCPRTCNYIQLEEQSIFNADGTVIDVSGLSSKHIFYDFSALKTSCLPCQQLDEQWTTPAVNPGDFVECLSNLSQVVFDDFRDCP